MESIYEHTPVIDIDITEDGYRSILIQDCDKSDLHIHIDKRRNTSLMITYGKEKNDIHTSITIEEGAQAKILFWNETQTSLVTSTKVLCKRDSAVTIGFGDVSAASAEYGIEVQLIEEGANCHIVSAALANHKHFQMKMEHLVPHTSGKMENFAIVKEQGDYRMEASGVIVKGAHDSVSHQATRGLTMSQNQKSEVIPVLLIDENEVKASHATTLGQPDENQLYYLQSRGLSRQQALGLLTLGYLMPITEVLQDEELQKQLQDKIEEKVIRNV